MNTSAPLAFVDVETTGLSPADNRIVEIGVVTVDGTRVERWTTLVKIAQRREPNSMVFQLGAAEDTPSFSNVATELAQRLSGRLLVAHNARFDHAFLRAEFDRVGIAFNPKIICSVMLSRRLYPQLARHDLNSLIEWHGLHTDVRHRALPDADVLWQWWQMIHRQHSDDVIGNILESLLAGPVLPPQLDARLVDRLPEAPGAYVLHGEHNQPLVVGAASNLRLHVLNYFRIDQASQQAIEYSHRVTNITWRTTRGMLGAQLHAATLEGVLFTNAKRMMQSTSFTWQLVPDAVPTVTVRRLTDYRVLAVAESFGIFATERKARNALVRIATKHRLCHLLLGVSEFAKLACRACPVDQSAVSCVGSISRTKQLMRLFTSLRPLRLPVWPYRGAVGIRERSDMHVIDQWQFLGTAQSESDLHGVLDNRPSGFDRRLYRLLNRTFSRLPQNKIVDLHQHGYRPPASIPTDIECLSAPDIAPPPRSARDRRSLPKKPAPSL